MTRDVSVINCERNNQLCLLSLLQQIKDELCEVVQEMESHDSENKHSSKEKQMSIGRKKFNMDPKKGETLSSGFIIQSFQRAARRQFLCSLVNHSQLTSDLCARGKVVSAPVVEIAE